MARTAEALVDALREIERIARRAEAVDLEGWSHIVRAGELLGKAADAHRRFVEQFAALTRAVEGVRDRHNRAAEGLSRAAERVDAARRAYEALQERFAGLGAAAVEIDQLLKSSIAPGGARDDDAVRASLAAVRDRLGQTVGEAVKVAEEARAAGLHELERRADGIRQQLEVMLGTVTRVTGPDA